MEGPTLFMSGAGPFVVSLPPLRAWRNTIEVGGTGLYHHIQASKRNFRSPGGRLPVLEDTKNAN